MSLQTLQQTWTPKVYNSPFPMHNQDFKMSACRSDVVRRWASSIPAAWSDTLKSVTVVMPVMDAMNVPSAMVSAERTRLCSEGMLCSQIVWP